MTLGIQHGTELRLVPGRRAYKTKRLAMALTTVSRSTPTAMQSMRENDLECFASTGVNTPGTMFPNSCCTNRKPKKSTPAQRISKDQFPDSCDSGAGAVAYRSPISIGTSAFFQAASNSLRTSSMLELFFWVSRLFNRPKSERGFFGYCSRSARNTASARSASPLSSKAAPSDSRTG